MILHPTIKLNLFKHLARKSTINWKIIKNNKSTAYQKETNLKSSKHIFFKQKVAF